MNQKNIFLNTEGDAWFDRNHFKMANRTLPEDDLILTELITLPLAHSATTKILEIGCGDGTRLSWLTENLGFECYGIEPSEKAVSTAKNNGVLAQVGTADKLTFDDKKFNSVIFGFCLYLCDRADLFRITSEADRVLADSGWLILLDFYSPTYQKKPYHHQPGLYSYKMDYRKLFTWHPAYECVTHKIRHHNDHDYTDDPNEWIAISVLRKSGSCLA